MRAKSLLLMSMVAAVLAGCDSGGIALNVSTTDNSVNNGGGGGGGGGDENPCASYTRPSTGTVIRGTFDGTNCTYSAAFVGEQNPLTVDLTLPAIPGVHIFQDALFVGAGVNTGPAPQAGNSPTAAGDGAVLTIEPGNTITFLDGDDYVLINRGSKIIAEGTPEAPIVFTGYTDAVTGTAGPEAVQLWGGLVINGNGITNNCTDAQRTANQCHVESEGKPSYYGGSNNDESSGILRYVIVKHPGFEVAPDNELNGITFNAVGRGTVVENIQVYSTFDDGIEMFGGAVNVKNAILMYVRDDSLDFSDGWVGTVENALVIQQQNDGNNCIELDNIGSARSDQGVPMNTEPVTVATVRNMTCIMSRNQTGGTHGASQGVIVRQGGRLILEDSIVDTSYAWNVLSRSDPTQNPCFQLQSDTGRADAVAGLSSVNDTILTCAAGAAATSTLAPSNNDTVLSWLLGTGSVTSTSYSFNADNSIVDPASASISVLTPGTFFTAETLTDHNGNPIAISPESGLVGAISADDDWTFPWAYGIREDNRGQPLWFAP